MAVDIATLSALPLPQLIAVSVVVVLLAAIVARVLSNTFNGKAPPIDEGIPFVGGLIKFSKGPLELMTEMYAKHGEVFTIPILHKKMTFLIGPNVSPHFFNATDEKMSQTEVYNFNVPTFGKDVVYDVDVKVRAEQFRIVGDSLKSAKLKSYVPMFVQEATDYFGKWGDTGEVDLMEVFGELIIMTASRTLLGREVREHMFNEVADLYHDLDDGMRPLSVIFPYAPTAYHRRRDAAREKIAEVFSTVLNARRASGASEPDMLQALMDANYQKVNGGRKLTDSEITGLLIAILFAGQHTSTVTSSWTGLRMMDTRATYDAAVQEQQEMLAKYGDTLDFDILTSKDIDVLHWNIHEALRMGPPLIMVMRYSKEPFTVTTSTGVTFEIPQNHIVACSPTFAHRLPHVFKNADDYEPDRFKAPREEQNSQFSYVGFGGGRHACMGQMFAMLQIKTIWSILLRNFEFEMIDPFPEPDYTSMVIGPKPCKVRYTRRKLAPAAPVKTVL